MSTGTRLVIWFSDPDSSNVRHWAGTAPRFGEMTRNLSQRRTTRAHGLLVIVSAAVLSLILAVKRVLGVPIAGSLALFAGGVAIYLS